MKKNGHGGFSFVEILVTVAIISLMFAGAYQTLASGQSSWFTADAQIQVQESLRKALDMVTMELRESKFSQVTVTHGAGFSGSDIVKFSIPVICRTGDNLLDANGDVAHWGATTRWGCRDPLCMDSNDTCASVEYKFIQYELIAGNQLVRKVLDPTNNLVRQDLITNNISNFKAVAIMLNSNISVTLTAQVNSVLNRPITVTDQNVIVFRNQ